MFQEDKAKTSDFAMRINLNGIGDARFILDMNTNAYMILSHAPELRYN